MKTTKLFSIGVLALLLASCGVNTPQNTVEQFFGAVTNGNATAAKELSTPETHEYVDNKLSKTLVPTNIECTENGNEATCNCLLNNDKEEVPLKLVNGKWKVHIELGFFDKLFDNEIIDKIKNIKGEDIDNAVNAIVDGANNLDNLSEKAQGIINKINDKKSQLESATGKAMESLTKEISEMEALLQKEIEAIK